MVPALQFIGGMFNACGMSFVRETAHATRPHLIRLSSHHFTSLHSISYQVDISVNDLAGIKTAMVFLDLASTATLTLRVIAVPTAMVGLQTIHLPREIVPQMSDV